MIDARVDEVMDYWFGQGAQDSSYFRARMGFWFMGGEKVDQEIRERFSGLVQEAGDGKLGRWADGPGSCLALVVLLDQFSLNVYRNGILGYRNSEMAVPLAHKILERRWDEGYSPAEKIFAYMPLEHSESLADQDLCVARFRRMVADHGGELMGVMEGSLEYALRHRKVVERFGRFPHRNQVLGRESTPEEISFLASSEAPF